MTPEEYIRMTIGELVVQNAMLKSDVDRLKAEIEVHKLAARPTSPSNPVTGAVKVLENAVKA